MTTTTNTSQPGAARGAAASHELVAELARKAMTPQVLELTGLVGQRIAEVRSDETGGEIELRHLPPLNRFPQVEDFRDLVTMVADRFIQDGGHADPAVFVEGARAVRLVFDRRTGYERAVCTVAHPDEVDQLFTRVGEGGWVCTGQDLRDFLRYEVPTIAPAGLERAIERVTWKASQEAVEERARGKESLGAAAVASVAEDALAGIAPLQDFLCPFFSSPGLRERKAPIQVHLDPLPADRAWRLRLHRSSLETWQLLAAEHLLIRVREAFEGTDVPVYAGSFRHDVGTGV